MSSKARRTKINISIENIHSCSQKRDAKLAHIEMIGKSNSFTKALHSLLCTDVRICISVKNFAEITGNDRNLI